MGVSLAIGNKKQKHWGCDAADIIRKGLYSQRDMGRFCGVGKKEVPDKPGYWPDTGYMVEQHGQQGHEFKSKKAHIIFLQNMFRGRE